MAAKSLMIMGTASSAGKSAVATGLCRAFARAGIHVVPFKSQNMSNNAMVCPGGGEIGRAQAAQAEACGLAPAIQMNPVLLKPESDHGCQVVVMGKARFRMTVDEHARYRERVWPEIVASYRDLAARSDLVVIEGAGGAAEVNLRDRDIVNWTIAELAGAPVLIVTDIDRGGAFASLVGTVELISPAERARVKGFLINRFRGDPGLLESGLRFLEERTGIPVLGVIPYLSNLNIPDEDSVNLDQRIEDSRLSRIVIGVVRLPRISNFTDFAPFENEPGVTVTYLTEPLVRGRIDVIVLPGTKSTVADLQWLRERGWECAINAHLHAGGTVVGVCGGFQMLGMRILDPLHVESGTGQAHGLGLLEIETAFSAEKTTARVSGVEISSKLPFLGYEIHLGRIIATERYRPLLRIKTREDRAIDELEGAVSADGRVIGTSVHGLFDSSHLRRRFLNELRDAKGMKTTPDDTATSDAFSMRLQSYDRFADAIESHTNITRIAALAEIDWSTVRRLNTDRP